VTWLELSMSELKRAAQAAGGTVNDAYLAGICGTLRHYHLALKTPVDRLTAGFPISIRKEGSGKTSNNQFTAALVELPVHEADIARRVRDIQEQVNRARENAAFNIMGAVAQVIGYLPPPTIQRLMETMPLPAIQASNIPGPREEMFLGGARVERMIGIGPISGGVFLAGLTAHGDAGTVGVTYDPAAIRDGDLFHKSLVKGFAEVLKLAPRDGKRKGGSGRGTGNAPKKRPAK